MYKQEEGLDEAGQNVQFATEQARDFEKEVKDQTKNMNNINKHMDATNENMVNLDNSMKQLIAKSNQKCLWFIFALEVVVLVLFIILL